MKHFFHELKIGREFWARGRFWSKTSASMASSTTYSPKGEALTTQVQEFAGDEVVEV